MTALRHRRPRVKRERPPMPPLAVRVQVAERQAQKHLPLWEWLFYAHTVDDYNLTHRLKWILSRIFEDGENVAPHALDHDPALVLRLYNPRIKDVAERYSPHAHDPDYLVYRAKEDHQQKTTGRKPGATRTVTTKGSDMGVAAKFRRLANPKKKAKIPSRKKAWPKRKFRSAK